MSSLLLFNDGVWNSRFDGSVVCHSVDACRNDT